MARKKRRALAITWNIMLRYDSSRKAPQIEHTKGDDLTQPFRLKLTINQAASGVSALKNARIDINRKSALGIVDTPLSLT